MTRHTATLTIRLGLDEKRARWHTFNDLLAEFAAVDPDEPVDELEFDVDADCTMRLIGTPTATHAGVTVVVEVRYEEDDPTTWNWPSWAQIVPGGCHVHGEREARGVAA